jgi:hypothetical protein
MRSNRSVPGSSRHTDISISTDSHENPYGSSGTYQPARMAEIIDPPKPSGLDRDSRSSKNEKLDDDDDERDKQVSSLISRSSEDTSLEESSSSLDCKPIPETSVAAQNSVIDTARPKRCASIEDVKDCEDPWVALPRQEEHPRFLFTSQG